MNVTIRGHNVKVNDAIEDFAQKKLNKLDRFLPGITDVHLELSHLDTKRGSDLNIAQITVRHRRGAILRSEERGAADFETTIINAVDKMYRRIERFKGKRVDKKRNGRFAILPEELSAAEELPELLPLPEMEEAETEPLIVRRKQVQVSAMSEEEAIEQMELLGHTFFLFFNSTSGSINVVYKRTAGGYGVLEPQLE